MTRPPWASTWLDVADVIARRSRCSRAQVGAVIVAPHQRLIATGYNGPPADWPIAGEFDELPPDYLDHCVNWCGRAAHGPRPDTLRSYEDCPSLHAEMNALMFVDRSACVGAELYTTGHICFNCAKAIANSGIVGVNVRDDDDREHRSPDQSYEFLGECGLYVRLHDR